MVRAHRPVRDGANQSSEPPRIKNTDSIGEGNESDRRVEGKPIDGNPLFAISTAGLADRQKPVCIAQFRPR